MRQATPPQTSGAARSDALISAARTPGRRASPATHLDKGGSTEIANGSWTRRSPGGRCCSTAAITMGPTAVPAAPLTTTDSFPTGRPVRARRTGTIFPIRLQVAGG
ncbi:hypothetical protein A6A25_26610 [Saccharothrix sp. CB00851]|nr:hypothetical protein A6A25_26610 [Saccharothrix sp. CB00851]